MLEGLLYYSAPTFLACLLAWLITNRQLVKQNATLKAEARVLSIRIIQMTVEHQRLFQEMISRVHHQGVVPISASALGLIFVISSGLAKCILSLKKLQDAQDWRTHTVSTELLTMMQMEVTLLELKLRELNTEVKRTANEYNQYQ